jgi:hypothetical protein
MRWWKSQGGTLGSENGPWSERNIIQRELEANVKVDDSWLRFPLLISKGRSRRGWWSTEAEVRSILNMHLHQNEAAVDVAKSSPAHQVRTQDK